MTPEYLRKLLAYDATTGVFTWRVGRARTRHGTVAGTLEHDGYRRIRIDRRAYHSHRLAWFYVHGKWPKDQIDHINGNRDDNCIANLREASRSQNLANARHHRRSKAPYKGITLLRGKWVAQISIYGRKRYLGYFDTPEAAHTAYCKAAQ